MRKRGNILVKKTKEKSKSKSKKARIDSIDEHVRIVQAAKKEIKPPDNMTTNEKVTVFFNDIISEKPKSEWSKHEISLAHMLARMMYELDFNQERMLIEGTLIKNARGGLPKMNPRRRLVTDYIDKIATLRRSLGIYASANGSEKFQIFKRNFLGKGIEQQVLSNQDDLIAYPPDTLQ